MDVGAGDGWCGVMMVEGCLLCCRGTKKLVVCRRGEVVVGGCGLAFGVCAWSGCCVICLVLSLSVLFDLSVG